MIMPSAMKRAGKSSAGAWAELMLDGGRTGCPSELLMISSLLLGLVTPPRLLSGQAERPSSAWPANSD
jgi:hypothetical protein